MKRQKRESQNIETSKHSIIHIQILIPESLTSLYNNDCMFNIKAFNDSIVESIINGVANNIEFSEPSPNIFLNKYGSYLPIDRSKSFLENDIVDGDHLEFQTSRKSKRLNIKNSFNKKNKNQQSSHDYYTTNSSVNNSLIDEDNDVIEVTCITRIADSNGQPYAPVKAKVNRGDIFRNLMEDVSTCWESKSGLKFKYGRIVLSSEKTYEDVEMEDGAIIVVTGGRQ